MLVFLWAAPAAAQTDPRTLPAVTAAPTYLGSFTLPALMASDGEDALKYGGMALGIAADGKSLYYACHGGGSFARVSIPALGGVATVLEACAGPRAGAAFGQAASVGGVLEYGGQKFLTAYGTYNAEDKITASHWSGAALSAMTGPYDITGGTIRPGLVAGYQAVVPSEWRALLGGPVLSGQCCISIISKSSYGPAAAVYDPLNRAINAVLLIGYPHDQPRGFGNYRVPSQTGYTGAEEFAGGFIPSSTSSLLFAWRHGNAKTECYGNGSSNPADHNKLVGGEWTCYDPTNTYKGPHGYPYEWQWLSASLADLAAVKAGAKKPWEIRPVTIPFADGNHDRHMGGMVGDPATNRVYVVEGGGATSLDGPRVPTIRVYQVGGTPPPPPPPAIDCQGVWSESLSAPTPLACDATQQQTRTRTRTFTMTTAPQNGGAACPASPVVDTVTSACTYTPPPPPVVPSFVGRIRSQAEYTKSGLVVGIRLTLQVPASQTVPAVGAAVRVSIPLASGQTEQRAATVYSRKANAYAGSTDWQVVVQLPGVQTLAIRVEIP
jgi:hypothetical protein